MKCMWICIAVLAYLSTPIDGIVSDFATMENLPGYAVTSGIERLNATRCRTEMEQFRNAINHRILWSLTMLDSSGQPSSGYIMGDNYWMGSKSQCDYLRGKRSIEFSPKNAKKNSLYRNPADEFPPFMVNFFGAYIRSNGTMQYHFSVPLEEVIVLGLCLPDSCTEHEVATMLNKVFDDRVLLFGHLYLTDFELIKVSNLKDNYTWLLNGKIIMIIVILVALFGSVIAGTFYDIFIYQARLQHWKEFCSNQRKIIELSGDSQQNRNRDRMATVGTLTSGESNEDKAQKSGYDPKALQELNPTGRLERILVSFSIVSSMKQIFQLKTGSEDISAFHSIKFFLQSWVIFFHTAYYMVSFAGNKNALALLYVSIASQLFMSAPWCVDIFFFIGGFLTSAGYFKSQRKGRKIVTFYENAHDFLIRIIKRLIRLTPPCVVTMLLSILIFSWVNNHLMTYIIEPIPEMCCEYWWRNILYIHNLFEWNSLCMTWSWYISNDMQFYIFGTFILKLSTSHYYSAMCISIVTLAISMLSAGYTAYKTGQVKTLDSTLESFTCMYMRPWIRIIPYIVAMGTAMFLEKRNYKLDLSKKVLAVGWFISISCFCWISHGPALITASANSTIIYETFSRLGWSLALAWVVIVCLTNNAATLNQFLSLPYWIPPGRVAFCAYLLNPILVLLLGVHSDYTKHIEVYFILIAGFGIWTITFILAFILSAATEVPTKLLLRVISSYDRTKEYGHTE